MTRRAGPMARFRDAYRAIGRVDRAVPEVVTRIEALAGRVDALAGRVGNLVERVESLEARSKQEAEASGGALVEVRAVLRTLAADEPGNRRCLHSAREHPDYELAWTEDDPLITVTIPTIGRRELFERALPSILGQTYASLEVVVAGDGAGPEIGDRLRMLGDDRIRFVDLGPRLPWSESEEKLWLVGATRGRNAATRLARGRWLVPFDDDDTMRPDCLEKLLELARARRAEVAYAQALAHLPDGSTSEFCDFPPRLGRFTWAAGMHHAGLACFERELVAAEFGIPGDWWLAERMLRAGARFAMREEVLCDVYPSGRNPGWVPPGAGGGATTR